MIPLELFTLKRWFHKACDSKNIDPQEFDFESIVDPSLTYYENKQLLNDEIKLLLPGAFLEEAWGPILEDEAQEARVARQRYMKEHALSHYILCSMEGRTVSSEMGPPIKRRFMLVDYINSFLG